MTPGNLRRSKRGGLLFYGAALLALSPIVLAAFLWRYGWKRTLAGLSERLGRGGPWPGGGSLWVHAASVGEVRAVEPFLDAAVEAFPNGRLLVTTTTVSGKELAAGLTSGPVVRLAPVDLPGPVRRVLERSRPRAIVLVETELWPGWLNVFRDVGIPVVIVNGRVSDRTFPFYWRVRRWLSPLMETVARVGVPGPVQASRFLQLGARSDAVVITGNLKHDRPLPDLSGKAPARSALGIAPEDLVLVAGSTHPGEEDAWRRVVHRLRPRHPSLRVIVAPRHRERAAAVARAWRADGWETSLRSEGGPWRALVVDTVGELPSLYAAGDAAFIGGSLAPRGGQNPLEPARWAVPVVWGPHMENFRDIADEFLARGAASVAQNEADLSRILGEFLASPEKRQAAGEAARSVAGEQRGAVSASLRLVLDALADAESERRP